MNMPNNISTYRTAITKHKNNWLHEGQQTDRGRHRGRHRAVCVLGLLHTSENAHIKRFMVTTTLTLISLVSHGRRNHKTFDSSKKIIWKTEVKAKVQDCEQYFCERVSYSSSHEPLQTFSQWFQPKGFAHSLHAYYLCHCIYIYILYHLVYIVISCVIYSVCVCVNSLTQRMSNSDFWQGHFSVCHWRERHPPASSADGEGVNSLQCKAIAGHVWPS